MPRNSLTLLPCAALALAAPLHGVAADSGGTCSIEYASPKSALAALRDEPGVEIREENGWVVASEPKQHVLWSITRKEHPAHPTAVKRCVFEHDGNVMMGMDVLCGADKSTCDQVVEQFRQLNASLSARMQR